LIFIWPVTHSISFGDDFPNIGFFKSHLYRQRILLPNSCSRGFYASLFHCLQDASKKKAISIQTYTNITSLRTLCARQGEENEHKMQVFWCRVNALTSSKK
jgi:hypothetical protein